MCPSCQTVFLTPLILLFHSSSVLYFTLFLKVPTDAGVDTLIPLSLQGKDNPILQQLLPTLLNSALLGESMHTLCSTFLF